MGEDDVESVLGNLDFREKGGYTRDVVEVTPVEAGRPAVRALPLFYIPRGGRRAEPA